MLFLNKQPQDIVILKNQSMLFVGGNAHVAVSYSFLIVRQMLPQGKFFLDSHCIVYVDNLYDNLQIIVCLINSEHSIVEIYKSFTGHPKWGSINVKNRVTKIHDLISMVSHSTRCDFLYLVASS